MRTTFLSRPRKLQIISNGPSTCTPNLGFILVWPGPWLASTCVFRKKVRLMVTTHRRLDMIQGLQLIVVVPPCSPDRKHDGKPPHAPSAKISIVPDFQESFTC